ncbi:VCBS repeat-containing protein, partial [Nostoc sp. CHAB 5844]|nr:VCBS repeat-containing protein [Nostoc sp. CHAB 5844]
MTTSVTFAPLVTYYLSVPSQTSAVGDFNKDGNLDLAYIDSNSLYVAFGNSSGSFDFTIAQYYGVGYGNSTSYSAKDVAVGDFNADGYLDLATANGSSRTVSVLLNNRSGSFSSAITFSVGSGAKNVKVGDFNGDGKDDIATGHNSSIISVLKNTGSGSFSTYSTFNLGQSNTRQVAVGDFNGDGYIDLARPNYSYNAIEVQFGDSAGSFGTTNYYSVGIHPTEVAVGDFNGDGILDLVSANSNNTVSVLLGNGSGSFGTATDFTVESVPNRVKVGDFNNDSKDDIITANSSSGNISVLLNNTIIQGNFTNPNDDIFQIGGSELTKVKIKIQIKGRSSALLNELGIFNVDDERGSIDGTAPGASGYQEKALARSKTIFSILANNPTGFTSDDLSRILEFDGGTRLRFYLKTNTSIVFSSTTTQQITSLSTGGFSIGWKDGSRGESIFDDLIINVQTTDEDLPIG